MVGPNDSIKIIDFDWAGRAGEVVYPPFMNKEIDWQPGVKVGEKILPEHDPGMLNNEFKNV